MVTTVIIKVGSDNGEEARGVFTPLVFTPFLQGLRRKKSLWKYNYIFLKMFFLTSGLILMSYITVTFCFKTLISYWWKLDGQICFLSGTLQCKLHSEHYYIALINVVHINNKIYILTPYSGYFGKIPGILCSRIIKICANIKLNIKY